jgi:hypothetical protein
MQKELAVSAKAAIILAVVRVIDRQNKIAKAAREAGEAAGREWGIQLGIEIGMKRAGELMARELHNFKFPDGKIDHENDALKQYEPKDNSTFEVKTQTYGERILEREAAQRNVRRRRSNRMVAKNRKRRTASKPNGTWHTAEDHGYDELLAEEGVYVKE